MNLIQPPRPSKTFVSLYFFFQVCRTKVIDLSEGISQHAWYPCTISYPYSQLAQTTFWVRVSQSFESLRLSGRGSQEALSPFALSQAGFVYPLRVLTARTENKTVSSRMLPEISSVQSLSRSDSLQPHESQHARPPCPSPSPGIHSDSRPSSR